MNGKLRLVLVVSLGVVLLASGTGVTRSSFIDPGSSTGNTFQAWTSTPWVQTTRGDFEAGVLNSVDISSSPGDVKLGSIYEEPTTSVGSEESWYYPSWSRRAPVTINNPGSGLTDYQVRVDVTYDADMQPDFDDIRFVDSDDSTELSHWRESYTASASAIFWAKVPSIPSGNKTIYMYYGNTAASSASDGNATFVFFDDFLGTSLDTTKWDSFTGTGGSISVASSEVKLDRAEILTKTYQITNGIIEHRGYSTAKEISMIARASTKVYEVFQQTETIGGHGYYQDGTVPSWTHAITKANVRQASVVSAITIDKWYKYRFICNGVNLEFVRFDDNWTQEATTSYTDTGGLTTGYIGLRVDGGGSGDRIAYYDWIRVREYASPEPTTSVGPEDGWSRRAPVTINNPGSGLTDYQVKVDVNYDTDMQPDFDDIRFVDSDDSTQLSHWRESYTASASATFWVKVPSIPSGNKIIYLYYGNTAASSASDGNATFIFFDDFDDASLAAAWTFTQVGGAVGSYAESGTVIRLTGTNTGDLWGYSDKFLFLSISGNYDNVVVESYTTAWGGSHQTWSKMGGVQLRQGIDAGSKNRIMSPVFSATGATNSYRLATGGITAEQITATCPEYNRISRTGGASGAWYSTDGITWTELGSQISFTGGLTDPVYLGIHLAGLSSAEHWVEVDWFRVRKYPPPSAYISSGSIASQVLNTGVDGARWDALFWDETLPSNTDITFKARASDTSFAKDAASPSWTSLGGICPVTSGLPSGRYMQWQATLTTSDPSQTPTLHEVRVYYSDY